MVQLPHSRIPRKGIAVFLVLAFLFGGIAFIGWRREQHEAGTRRVREAEETLETLPFFRELLQENISSPREAWDVFTSLLREGTAGYGASSRLVLALTRLAQEVSEAREEFPLFLFEEGVAREKLEAIHSEIEVLEESFNEFVSLGIVGEEHTSQFLRNPVTFKNELARWREFVEALIVWIEDPAPRHVIVFFQNSAEMRPTGGFLGSFADITFREGAIRSITIHDVNEVDRARTRRVVPPFPLQLIATRWRVADANWFFDFPTSAEKLIRFMEESELYGGETAPIEGVIMITPRVVEDILSLVGPIETEDGVVIDGDTFLSVIQKDVQENREFGVRDPKRILKELAIQIEERVNALSEDARTHLSDFVLEWISEKDLMAFMEDVAFASFLTHLGADGKMYDLGEQFTGDYLAVVGANIEGAKTDMVVSQDVSLESTLLEDGVVRNHVVVTRTHRGDEREEWWYRVPNQIYLRIFTPLGTRLTGASGGERIKVSAPVNYAAYEEDKDVVDIESTLALTDIPSIHRFVETGKNVFATWMKVGRGEHETFSMSYTRRLSVPPGPGRAYVFVLETQPGVTGTYRVMIHAPAGYRWQKNNRSTYEYVTDDPKGREIITLELTRVEP